jgi:MFS transporter, PHS family, inorganic phosphate transporter
MDIERNVQRAAADIQHVLAAAQDGPEFNRDAAVQRAEAPRATWINFWRYFSQWDNGKVLLGTAYSWFAVDVCS